MPLWRISSHCTLDGLGGERASGRWHTAFEGKPVVYMAEHPALALLESLVNFSGDPAFAPSIFQLIKIEVAARLIADSSQIDGLSSSWQHRSDYTRAIGDAWLSNGASALLKVPSVPSPESWNYLLNPLHRDAGQIAIEWCRWLTYDRRVFGIREKR